MFIYNGFGITPTRNHQAAGIDFFIPNVKDNDPQEKITNALEGLKKSFNLTDADVNTFIALIDQVADMFSIEYRSLIKINKINILHLFYGLKSHSMMSTSDYLDDKVKFFVNEYLVFDKNGNPGIKMRFSDMIFINSGIKVALNPYTSLEFKNKSGRGMQGWSVKACLVDEDYSGYMHLSLQYLWYDEQTSRVYVGDKITQATVQQVLTDDAQEISLEEYTELMKNSKRGSQGFGSSDIKH